MSDSSQHLIASSRAFQSRKQAQAHQKINPESTRCLCTTKALASLLLPPATLLKEVLWNSLFVAVLH